jgi:hypothetical protein
LNGWSATFTRAHVIRRSLTREQPVCRLATSGDVSCRNRPRRTGDEDESDERNARVTRYSRRRECGAATVRLAIVAEVMGVGVYRDHRNTASASSVAMSDGTRGDICARGGGWRGERQPPCVTCNNARQIISLLATYDFESSWDGPAARAMTIRLHASTE